MRRSRGAITDEDNVLAAAAPAVVVASTGLPLVAVLVVVVVVQALFLGGPALVLADTDAALEMAGRRPFIIKLWQRGVLLPGIAAPAVDTGRLWPTGEAGRFFFSTKQSSSALNSATFRRSSSGIVLDTMLPLCAESRFHSSSAGRGDRRAGCCSIGGAMETGRFIISRGGATTTGPPDVETPWWMDVAAVPASETADIDAAYEYDDEEARVVVVELDGERCSSGGRGRGEPPPVDVLRRTWTGGSAATVLS